MGNCGICGPCIRGRYTPMYTRVERCSTILYIFDITILKKGLLSVIIIRSARKFNIAAAKVGQRVIMPLFCD